MYYWCNWVRLNAALPDRREAAERAVRAPPVPQLPVHGEGLLVQRRGAFPVAPLAGHVTQVDQRHGHARPVPERLVEFESLLVQAERAFVLAAFEGRAPEAGQTVGDAPAVLAHFHPAMEESFTVVRGRLGYRLNGREGVAGPGERLHLPHGAVHDWWNVGEEEAHVLVEISPAARFGEMIGNAYGLARDGKTDAKGQLHLLQAALFAREFDDVIRFTSPPRPVQKALFGALAPIARFLGYRGSYPKYLGSLPSRPGGPEPRSVGAAADESPRRGAPEDEKARA